MRILSITSLVVAVVLGLAGLGKTQENSDALRAVLKRAVEAHGGVDALNKFQGARTKAKGKIDILGGADFSQQTALQYPNKFRDEMEMQIAGQNIKVTTIWNGTDGSIEANGQKVPVNGAIKDALRDAAETLRAMRLVGMTEPGYELSSLGEAQVNDQPAVGVRVAKKDRRDLNLFFDKKTGLLAKMEHRVVDQMTGQEVTEERIVQEYQKMEGLATAKRVLILRDGKRFIEAEILEVKLVERIDDGEFALP